VRLENYTDQNQLSVVGLRPPVSEFRTKCGIVFSDPLALLQETARLEAASEAKLDTKAPEFGEERVIIVRDKETRDELQEKLRGFAMVSTILQSKGMEFEDVFLYNFFTTSPKSHDSDFGTLEKLLYERHSAGRPSGSNLISILALRFNTYRKRRRTPSTCRLGKSPHCE
jgi:hypothetical protein